METKIIQWKELPYGLLNIRVRVIREEAHNGGRQVLIEPVSGFGRRWVRKHRLRPDDATTAHEAIEDQPGARIILDQGLELNNVSEKVDALHGVPTTDQPVTPAQHERQADDEGDQGSVEADGA